MKVDQIWQTAVVLGAQWGDEGKGKVVDVLGESLDCAARFQGGNNAGHTVVINGQTHKLNLLPSALFHPNCNIVLCNGMVIDPSVLIEEIERVGSSNLTHRLFISDRAHVILPFHIAKDKALDALGKKSQLAAGSTHRGIGPVYADKMARLGIRMIDLLDEPILEQKLRFLFDLYTKELKYVFGLDFDLDFATLKAELLSYGSTLAPNIVDTTFLLRSALNSGQQILFEGAQGAMLDVDFGLYPYSTSSNTGLAAIGTGTGLPPWKIDRVIGVIKAYLSRVGDGYLPTELLDPVGNTIREYGQEYGTTTGRPRRIGWLDLVQLRHATALNGFTRLAITKLDILTWFKEIKVCVAYKVGSQIIDHFPAKLSTYHQCEPVYKTFPGWPDLSAALHANDLPDQLLKFVNFIKQELGVPIELLSVGADREQTIIVSP